LLVLTKCTQSLFCMFLAVIPLQLRCRKVGFMPSISRFSKHWNISLVNALLFIPVTPSACIYGYFLVRSNIPIELTLASSIESIGKRVLEIIDCLIEKERGAGPQSRYAGNGATIPARAHIAAVIWFKWKCGVWKRRSING
jgi:hypothetical protein